MVEKDKDLFLDMLENPNLTLEDMVSVGHSAESTRFLDKSMYENSQRVRSKFMDPDGNFKQDEFNKWYAVAADAYHKITDKDSNLSLLNVTAFNESDITVSPDKRTLNTKPIVSFTPNPDRLSTSIFRIGKTSERERTLSELALAEKVLLNPVEAAQDPSKARWGDSPNDSWWGNFFDTLVLAQWDEDGEHIDPVTKQKTTHKKGELKLNDNGTYYYEALDGRDIYGRLVLNKMNTITTDGTFWNQYDFFDSDDIKEKSFVGSVAKNLALVGSMFIPYVGWGIAGASVGVQVMGLTGTLGKMLTGSDSPTFSAMEGWAKSFNRLGAKSEYAQQNMLCWENFIDLIGDTTALLREQRAIFKFAPALFGKGKYGIDSKHFGMNANALKAKETAALAKEATPNLSTMKMARAVGAETPLEAVAALGKANAVKDNIISNIADKAVADYFKSYNKLGEQIARGYMIGITVGDTYGEAKEAGASDFEATMLTLGYAAAENKLLSSELGRWIFPELKTERAKMTLIAKVLTQTPEKISEAGISNSLKTSGIKTARAELIGKRIKDMPLDIRDASKILGKLDDNSRTAWMKKWFNAGKEIFDQQKSVMRGTMGAAIANALAEGTEEVSEELLKDFSTSCFNLVKAALGDKTTRMLGFLGEWDWNEALKRYGMSFFGGMVGGGINSAAYDYKQFKDIANMTSDLAMQLLVWMDRNNEMDTFWDVISKLTLGDKYHSTKQNEDGSYKLGDENDNQDLEVKRAIRNQIDLIHNILASEGASIDDDGLIGQVMNALPAAKNHDILGEFRANALATSVTAGRFLKEYNNLCKAIVLESIHLKNLTKQTTDSLKPTDDLQQAINESTNTLKALLEAKERLLSGERSAEFYKDALFETTYGVSESFLAPTEIQYAERLFKKPYILLNEAEKKEAKEKYATWSTTERAELIHQLSEIFYDIAGKTSEALLNSSEMYQKLKDGQLKRLQEIMSLSAGKLGTITDILNFSPEDKLALILDILSGIAMDSNINPADPLGLIVDLYEDYSNTEASLSDVQNAIGNRNNVFIDTYRTIVEDPNLNNELKANLLVLNFAETIYKELTKTALEIIDTGYIHPEVKRDLLPTLKQTLDYCLNLKGSFDERMEIQEEEGNLTNSENAAKLSEKFDEMSAQLETQIELIESLNYTPISENLRNFALSAGADLNVLSLIENIINKEIAYKDSVSDLLLNDTDATLFEEAEKILKLYRTAIVAARHDNADLNHIFGYNKTLNELCGRTDGWIPLAEIDADTANLAMEDINLALSRLEIIKGISDLNQGNKLNTQNHTAANKSFILFNKTNKALTSLLNEDDDDAKAIAAEWDLNGALSELKEALNSMVNHRELTGDTVKERTLNLNLDLKEQIERELHLMDDAIYNFFLKNLDKLDGSEKSTKALARLFKAMGFDFYHKNDDLLTLESDTIDDNAYLWWFASKAALKGSDFYNTYRKIISNDIAPIPTLELGIYAATAAIYNGSVFDAFASAARLYILEDWTLTKTPEERLKIWKENKLFFVRNGLVFNYINYEYDDISEILLSDLMPNYSNILFIEGIPGSGKSTGVFKTIAKILNELNPKLKNDKEFLSKPIIVAHSTQENAEKLAGSLAFKDGTRITPYGKEELLSWMSSEYRNRENPDTNQYEYYKDTDVVVGSDGLMHSTWKIKLLPEQDVPSVLFIDEWSRYTQPEVDLINRFASEYGIQVIAGGDMDLLSPKAFLLDNANSTIKDNSTEELSNSRNIVPRVPKLGISMRTGNGQKTRNLHNLQARQRHPENKETIELLYVEDDKDLYGDKVHLASDEISDATLQEIKADIDKLIKNLDTNEKIGYIYSDLNSKLFKLLNSAPYKDKIDFKSEAAALGMEARYYIVENNRKEVQEADTYLKSLYTGISRAEQASLVIAYSGVIDGIRVRRPQLLENKLIPDNFSADGIARFAKLRKALLDKIYDGQENPDLENIKLREPNPIQVASRSALQNNLGAALQNQNQGQQALNLDQGLLQNLGQQGLQAPNPNLPTALFKIGDVISNGTNSGYILSITEPNPGEFVYNIRFGSEDKNLTELELLSQNYQIQSSQNQQGINLLENNLLENNDPPEEETNPDAWEVNLDNVQKLAGAINAISVEGQGRYIFTLSALENVLNEPFKNFEAVFTELINQEIVAPEGNNYEFFPDNLSRIGMETPEEGPKTPKYAVGDVFKFGAQNNVYTVTNISWDDTLGMFKYTLKRGTGEIFKYENNLEVAEQDGRYILHGTNETPDGRLMQEDLPEASQGSEALQLVLEDFAQTHSEQEVDVKETKDGDIDYTLFGYTWNTNYLGVEFDELTGLPKMPLPGEFGDERIDCANGLIKLDAGKFNNRLACLDTLGVIRQALQFESNDDICQIVREEIPSLKDTPISMEWAFISKAKEHYTDSNRRFHYDSKFQLENMEDAEHAEIPRKTLSALFFDTNGNCILEIPIVTLGSPFTALHLLGNINKLNPIYEEFKKAMDAKDDPVVVMQRVIKAIEKSPITKALNGNLKPGYWKLYNICKLWQFTSDGIKIISQQSKNNPFNLARDCKNLGSKYVKNRFLDETKAAGGERFAYKRKWHNLTEEAKRTDVYFSQIMLAPTELNDDFNDVIPPGHTFVLKSDSYKFRSTSDMMELYFKLLRDPSEPKYITLIPVVPPQCSISKYLKERAKLRDCHYGREFTPYLILSLIRKLDPNGLWQSFDAPVRLLLKPILDELDAVIINTLLETGESHIDYMRRIYAKQKEIMNRTNAIHECSTALFNRTFNHTEVGKFDEEFANNVERLLAKDPSNPNKPYLEGVLYRPVCLKGESAIIGNYGILVEVGDNQHTTPDGESYRIDSKYDSPKFDLTNLFGRIGKWVGDIQWKIPENPNLLRFKSTWEKNKYESSGKVKTPKEKTPNEKLFEKYTDLLGKLGLKDYDKLKSISDETKFLEAIRDKYIETPGNIAVVTSGNQLIYMNIKNGDGVGRFKFADDPTHFDYENALLDSFVSNNNGDSSYTLILKMPNGQLKELQVEIKGSELVFDTGEQIQEILQTAEDYDYTAMATKVHSKATTATSDTKDMWIAIDNILASAPGKPRAVVAQEILDAAGNKGKFVQTLLGKQFFEILNDPNANTQQEEPKMCSVTIHKKFV